MAGLGMMPTNGKLQTQVGDQFNPDAGYRSRIDKATEEAPLGYYKVYMADTRIWAEVTSTERASFQRYTFPKDQDGRFRNSVAKGKNSMPPWERLLKPEEIDALWAYVVAGEKQ
jgi:putative alpha-1,2-mannosidase